jgi:dihydroxyacetone kinase
MSLHSLAWWAKVFSTALVGRIFQSPTPGQIEVAMIDRVDGTKGIVAIVMNHQVGERTFSDNLDYDVDEWKGRSSKLQDSNQEGQRDRSTC